jgi:hypothetical protein
MSSRLLAATRSTWRVRRREHPYLEARAVDLLRQLVHGDIAGCAHKDGALAKLDQMVHNSRRGDSLACARGPLDEAEGPLQGRLDGIHLRVVEVGEAGGREPGVRADHKAHTAWAG